LLLVGGERVGKISAPGLNGWGYGFYGSCRLNGLLFSARRTVRAQALIPV